MGATIFIDGGEKFVVKPNTYEVQDVLNNAEPKDEYVELDREGVQTRPLLVRPDKVIAIA